jgi:monoamine oxidase
MEDKKESPHVVIVGAGLSGLTAAREILKASPNAKVTVLEANDYVGGRTKTIILNNCNFDLGAEFIGPTQHHVIDLAIESKAGVIPVNDKGRKVVDLKEGRFTYNSSIPHIGSILSLVEMDLTFRKINRMAQKVSSTNPKNCQLGHKWDSLTVQNWIDQNISSTKTKVMLEGAIRVVLGVELSEVSFLYLLLYIKQSKDFENIISVENGLQEKKTEKGTQHMSQFLAEQIEARGGSVKLNFLVKAVQQG